MGSSVGSGPSLAITLFKYPCLFGGVLSLAEGTISIELELSGVGLFCCLKSQTENCSTAIELTEAQLLM